MLLRPLGRFAGVLIFIRNFSPRTPPVLAFVEESTTVRRVKATICWLPFPLRLVHQLSESLGFQHVDRFEQESVFCYDRSYSTLHWAHRSCAPTIIYRCTTSRRIHASLDPVRKRKACYDRTCRNRYSTPGGRAWKYTFRH